MPSRLPVFEAVLKKRGRVWRWSVCTAEGEVVMHGAESRRTSARYKANRALFLMLLCAPYAYVRRRNSAPGAVSQSGHSRSRT
jgi:hypothetical protein